MDRLDLRLAEYFVAVAEELHFGRAAARLHLAQPSLSQQVRKLERQLGTQLFARTSRKVELTSAGAALLPEARRALAQARRAVEAARAAADGRLLVGFYGSASSALMTGVLQVFAERLPAVEVVLRELELSHIEPVADGQVDIAFTRLGPGEADLEIEVLLSEPRVVVLPAGHHLAGRDAVRFADLRGELFITGPQSHNPAWRAQWLAEQRAHGLDGRVVAEASSVQEILTLVAVGRGVCIVPEPAARLYPRQDVAYVLVQDAEPALVSLAWARDRLSPTAGEFRAIAREVAEGTRENALAPR